MNVRYRPPEAAKILCVSESTLAKWRVYGTGPKFVRMGTKLIVYPEDALEEFLSARTHVSTSEYDTNPGTGRPRREKRELEEDSVRKQRA